MARRVRGVGGVGDTVMLRETVILCNINHRSINDLAQSHDAPHTIESET